MNTTRDDQQLQMEWYRVSSRLKAEIGDTAFENWVKPISVSGLEGSEVRLGVPSRFMRDWVRTHYADRIRALWRGVYPELRNHKDFVQTVLRLEEEKFQQAFQSGHAVLSDALAGGQRLGGDVVFRLWDTYGFPVEMTEEIAREEGVEVDMEGFRGEMEAQRERGRAAGQFTGDRARIRVY